MRYKKTQQILDIEWKTLPMSDPYVWSTAEANYTLGHDMHVSIAISIVLLLGEV